MIKKPKSPKDFNYVPQPLGTWFKTVEDVYIIETIAKIKATRKWDCNAATYALLAAAISEWETRYGSKKIPVVLDDQEMVLAGEIKI